MKLHHAIATLLLLGLLTACSLPHTDLTSPCVGNDGSPCARHPVNDWWMNQAGQGEAS